MKKIKQIVRTLTVIIFLISFTNCENEKPSLTNQDSSIIDAKIGLKKAIQNYPF